MADLGFLPAVHPSPRTRLRPTASGCSSRPRWDRGVGARWSPSTSPAPALQRGAGDRRVPRRPSHSIACPPRRRTRCRSRRRSPAARAGRCSSSGLSTGADRLVKQLSRVGGGCRGHPRQPQPEPAPARHWTRFAAGHPRVPRGLPMSPPAGNPRRRRGPGRATSTRQRITRTTCTAPGRHGPRPAPPARSFALAEPRTGPRTAGGCTQPPESPRPGTTSPLGTTTGSASSRPRAPRVPPAAGPSRHGPLHPRPGRRGAGVRGPAPPRPGVPTGPGAQPAPAAPPGQPGNGLSGTG